MYVIVLPNSMSLFHVSRVAGASNEIIKKIHFQKIGLSRLDGFACKTCL